MITKKIVLVGDFSTGKTSLIRRYVDNEFSDDYLTTIGVKISKKTLTLKQIDVNIQLQLMIWDIEGSVDFKPINPSYIMGSHGLLIVADITRDLSMNNIGMHIQQCKKIAKNAPILLVLNKADLIENEDDIREIKEKLQKEHSDIGVIYDASAKDGRNVEKIFSTISEKIIPQG